MVCEQTQTKPRFCFSGRDRGVAVGGGDPEPEPDPQFVLDYFMFSPQQYPGEINLTVATSGPFSDRDLAEEAMLALLGRVGVVNCWIRQL